MTALQLRSKWEYAEPVTSDHFVIDTITDFTGNCDRFVNAPLFQLQFTKFITFQELMFTNSIYYIRFLFRIASR